MAGHSGLVYLEGLLNELFDASESNQFMSKIMQKQIRVERPLVILHGDEMAQIAFDRVLATFVRQRLDIELIEFDLSAEQRLVSNGQVVLAAIEALKLHGVGVKNAGMTVNRAQLDEMLAKYPSVAEDKLDKLATKSPNGAIRKGIEGNITREDIPFENIRNEPPQWQGRDIDVVTMTDGGNKDSYNALSKVTGFIKVLFVGSSGDPVELHRREINKGDPWLLASNDTEQVKRWAHQFFQRALDEHRPAWLGLKDTVIAGYDGVMRAVIENIFVRDYRDKFAAAKLDYHYELIDAQAARIISNPPDRALWGVPENTTGRKLEKLVEYLKEYGIPSRKHHVSIARMSAGGGDQYGSFNMPVPEDGIVKVVLDGDEKHARKVRKGDPIMFMHNNRQAIKDWVSQVFRDASVKDKEVYFGLKREFMEYDDVFSTVINEVREDLLKEQTRPPSFMIMRPSMQLRKMISDPPKRNLQDRSQRP